MANKNQDWDDLGRSIQDIVDRAVNSRDFQKLNQTVSQAVGKAVDMGSEAVRKAMEAAGLTVEDKAEKVEIDDTAESTIFSGMSAEEAQEHMAVGTGVKKAAEAENEKTEGNADANTSEEPSDEAEKTNETAEGESEEKNDGSEN